MKICILLGVVAVLIVAVLVLLGIGDAIGDRLQGTFLDI